MPGLSALITLMNAGVKAVPSTAYAVGLTGVAAAAGIVYTIFGDAITGGIVVFFFLFLMFLLLIFSVVAGAAGILKWAGVLLAYSAAIVTALTFFAVFSCLFFECQNRFLRLWDRLLGPALWLPWILPAFRGRAVCVAVVSLGFRPIRHTRSGLPMCGKRAIIRGERQQKWPTLATRCETGE